MTQPKVSVIIPVYNREKYLHACLKSATEQSLKNIEIICVNDGSTDNSLNIIKEYAQKDDRIVIIDKQNEGVSRARNDAMQIAKGEYIGFLDSDDVIDNDYFEKLYNAAVRTNSDIACASIYRTDTQKYMLKITKERVFKKKSKKFKAANLPDCCYSCNKIYKTEKIREYNCYFKDGVFYEDMPWTFRTFYLLGTMVTVPNVSYHYVINSSSIVKQKTAKHKRDYAEAVEFIRDFSYKYDIRTSMKSWRGKWFKRSYVDIFGLRLIRIEDYKFAKCYYLFDKILLLSVRVGLNQDLIVNPMELED